jgi:hypothetical protein
MIIKTLDGIEIHCLPDNAVCYASDGCVSPEKLMACPIGGEECCPEGCPYYDEVDIKTIETPPWEHTFCNRIITRGRDVCIVKDTCDGCAMNPGRCAINDLLEQNGTLANWETTNLLNFREREKENT